MNSGPFEVIGTIPISLGMPVVVESDRGGARGGGARPGGPGREGHRQGPLLPRPQVDEAPPGDPAARDPRRPGADGAAQGPPEGGAGRGGGGDPAAPAPDEPGGWAPPRRPP